MFAVISTCGKQYKVSPGDVVYLDAKLGDEEKTFDFSDVLLFSGNETLVGKPKVEGASVKAEVMRHSRGPKIKILYHRRRKNSRRKMGFRQDFTRLLITEVHGGNGETEKLEAKKKKEIIAGFQKPAASEAKGS